MIVTQNGRSRSIRTQDEEMQLIAQGISKLDPKSRILLDAVMKDMMEGDDSLLQLMGQTRYRWHPVPMRQFMEDPYYLGEGCATLYPKLKDYLCDVVDTGGYREVVLGGGIGVGKCAAATTIVVDAESGHRATVKELADSGVTFKSSSFDYKLKKWVVADATAMKSGRKRLDMMRCKSGKKIGLSPDHPVMTPTGWKELQHLKVGDLVATQRWMPEPTNPIGLSDAEVKLIAYMLSDGGCTTSTMSFTNEDPLLIEDCERSALALGCSVDDDDVPVGLTAESRSGKAWTFSLPGMSRIRRKWCLFGLAKCKRLHADLHGMSNRHVALFLNRFIACDGHVNPTAGQVEITLASEDLIDDLVMLMARFGIHVQKSFKMASYVTKYGERRCFDAWRISVTGGEALRLIEATGPILAKEDACRKLCDLLMSRKRNPNSDVSPMGYSERKRLRADVGGISKQLWNKITSPTWQRMSVAKLHAVKTMLVGLPDWCDWWLNGIFWDEVEAIDIGVEDDVYDVSVPAVESWTGNGIVVHNTFCMSILVCRQLYEMSCLVSPQESFGLSKGSEIVYILLSKSLHLARTVMMTAVMDKINISPYFQEHAKPHPRRDTVEFPNNVMLSIASCFSERALGANVFGGAMDEINFMAGKGQVITGGTDGGRKTLANFDLAEKVYGSMVRRIKSRFQRADDSLPGMMVLLSSKTTHGAFLDRKIEQSKKDPTVFVREMAAWEVKPEAYFGKTFFRVLVGVGKMRNKLLEPDEQPDEALMKDTGSFIVEIPDEYLPDFKRDLEEALREIAGVSTNAVKAFIQRVETVEEIVKKETSHPFTAVEWQYGQAGEFIWPKLAVPFKRRLPGGFEEDAWRPIRNPQARRFLHIDIGLTKDSLGIAMGHVERWVDVVRRSAEGEEYADLAPYVVIDFMLRVLPPVGEQIFLPDIRRLVYELMAHGFSLCGFTCDSFQSTEMIQQMKTRGVNAYVQSVDTTMDPYDALKSAMYEHRIEVYEYSPLQEELIALEYDSLKNKVDHPTAGSKDVADAVAGVVIGLIRNANRAPLPPSFSEEADPDDKAFWSEQSIKKEPVKPKKNELKVQPLPFLMDD